jgi:hypothetical protein
MDLTVDGNVVTGTWVETTAKAGYYRGARYHGAIQLLADPTRRRLAGKWVGFGNDMDINTGPWELLFMDASTSMKTLEEYNRRTPADRMSSCRKIGPQRPRVASPRISVRPAGAQPSGSLPRLG